MKSRVDHVIKVIYEVTPTMLGLKLRKEFQGTRLKQTASRKQGQTRPLTGLGRR